MRRTEAERQRLFSANGNSCSSSPPNDLETGASCAHNKFAVARIFARLLPRHRSGKNREELQKTVTESDVYRHFCAASARSLQRCFVCSTNLLEPALAANRR